VKREGACNCKCLATAVPSSERRGFLQPGTSCSCVPEISAQDQLMPSPPCPCVERTDRQPSTTHTFFRIPSHQHSPGPDPDRQYALSYIQRKAHSHAQVSRRRSTFNHAHLPPHHRSLHPHPHRVPSTQERRQAAPRSHTRTARSRATDRGSAGDCAEVAAGVDR